MKKEGLTNSKFASILGIQRSNITHIVDGRNKPSFNFIEKFMAKFPHVNIEWLLTGTGEMYKQSEVTVKQNEATVKKNEDVPPTLFSETDNQSAQISEQMKNVNMQIVNETKQITDQNLEPEKMPEKETVQSIKVNNEITQSGNKSQNQEQSETSSNIPKSNTHGTNTIEIEEREIDCVLIFHSDRTFKYYKPV
jgi:plasmid maintenance system antidote protein VapI